ncbi:MAG TPA: sigma-70 family RNA polymerase sigma factor [Candidatus Baltobacteraceae bacterium]|nr:sigma-70 family RNA polymerase sigma factor [Candidatus Baltobacteraceae bacterium]
MSERDATIASYLPLVRKIARRIKRLVSGLDLDDLIGDGSVGLIRAIDTFDPQRGPLLRQYARRLIVGAMLNGIRRMDPVSERARRIARDGENRRYAIAMERGELPSMAEMNRHTPGFERAVAATHWGQPLSLDAPLPEGESVVTNWHEDPARVVESRQDRAALERLVESLPPRQRRIVAAHYFGGRSLRAIGEQLAVSPQRVSQLHLNAISSLRERARAAPR